MQDIAADRDRLAGKVAERLVVRALQQLVGGAGLPLAITVHAEAAAPPQKLLGPGRKKPGPKPGTRRAKPGPKLKATAAPRADSTLPKRCRHCYASGTCVRVAGSETQLACTACNKTWRRRTAKGKRGPYKTEKRRAALCVACEHPAIEHTDFTGACLHKGGCVCKGFFA